MADRAGSGQDSWWTGQGRTEQGVDEKKVDRTSGGQGLPCVAFSCVCCVSDVWGRPGFSGIGRAE